MQIYIDRNKEINDTHVAHFFHKLWESIPNSIEKSALGGERLLIAFRPIVIEMREYFIAKAKEEIVEDVKRYKKHYEHEDEAVVSTCNDIINLINNK